MRLGKQRTDVVLGIDVGTQSTKCVVLDEEGKLRGVGQQGYDVLTPRPQWAEQDPSAWWDAAVVAIQTAMSAAGVSADAVRGIGVTGQMHGVVLIGQDLAPLRPAIIWMDRRSANMIESLQARVPPDILAEIAGNRLSPGFAGATLAWLTQTEPDTVQRTRAVLQPKDYLVLRLTGVLSSDPSDASATWLYDVSQRRWSEKLAAACDVPMNILPPVNESVAPIGRLRPDPAAQLGLRPDIPVVAGAADQAALLVGAGVIEPGRGSITIGTGGQITVVSHRPRVDPELRLNTFCHAAPDRWYTMGAILNGGIALRWWRDVVRASREISYSALLDDAARVPPGASGLIFLPYLEGERTPHMDPEASGAFIGLTRQHTQAHMTRAVLEGVAFAFRDCLDALTSIGPAPDHFLIGGGGAQGTLWRQIMASVLGASLQTVAGAEHTAVGAAMLAGVGTEMFYDMAQAVARSVTYGSTDAPDPAAQPVYREMHQRYQAIYPALRALR